MEINSSTTLDTGFLSSRSGGINALGAITTGPRSKSAGINALGAITTGPRSKAGAVNVLRIIRTTYATSSLRGSRGEGEASFHRENDGR